MKEFDKYIQFEELLKYDDIVHLSTKKPFNFSKNIKEEEINKQYQELKNILNYDFIVKKPNQTHTNVVQMVTEENINDNFLNTDGLITNLKGVGLAISTADCQGILLYDPIKKVIGSIHSGWKGTLNKITMNAINLMINEYNSNPSDVIACISPSILKCCFEVDLEVVDMFQNNFTDINEFIYKGEIKDGIQKYFIDTIGINKNEMMKLELKEENIICSNICTKCNHLKYHSYRYDHDLSGRNISLICLK